MNKSVSKVMKLLLILLVLTVVAAVVLLVLYFSRLSSNEQIEPEQQVTEPLVYLPSVKPYDEFMLGLLECRSPLEVQEYYTSSTALVDSEFIALKEKELSEAVTDLGDSQLTDVDVSLVSSDIQSGEITGYVYSCLIKVIVNDTVTNIEIVAELSDAEKIVSMSERVVE